MSNIQGYVNNGFAPAPGGYPPQQQSSYPPQQAQGSYPPQQSHGGYPPQQQLPVQQSGGKDQNASGQPAGIPPTAPPIPDQQIAGYENVAYSKAISAGPPPAYTEAIQDTTIDTSNLSSITEEEAKEALQEYVSQQCCYGSKPANEMKIKDITSTSAFHVGGPVDGPYNGPAPSPWSIPCSFAETFRNQELKMEVPHTAFVIDCHVCLGAGFERCNICHGKGRVVCSRCNGKGTCTEFRDGQEVVVICSSCNGSGKKSCATCSGSGSIQCRECKGFCQLKQYIELTVSFTNRKEDHIVEKTDMPDHLIREAQGDTLLEQVAVRVGPVVGFFEGEINERSHSIVQKHATQWPNDRIIQQRQILRAVPVYECRFKFEDEEGRFWVYGKQKCVFTNDYPHTCCCCKCTIL